MPTLPPPTPRNSPQEPYSLHCCLPELAAFVRALAPAAVGGLAAGADVAATLGGELGDAAPAFPAPGAWFEHAPTMGAAA